MNAVTRDVQLANGDTVKLGMNFYTLNLFTKYPGGLGKLQRELNSMKVAKSVDDDSNVGEHDQLQDDTERDQLPDDPELVSSAMDAFSYLFWALIRSGGKVATQEECAMAIGLEDFPVLLEVFEEFNKRSKNVMPKNAKRRTRKR